MSNFLQDLLRGTKGFTSGVKRGAKNFLAAFDDEDDKDKKVGETPIEKIGILDDGQLTGGSETEADAAKAKLDRRIKMRDRITQAFQDEDPDSREGQLDSIRAEGTNPDGDYGISASAMDREILEERKNFVGSNVRQMRFERDAKKKADYDAFFARASGSSRLGQSSSKLQGTSNVYQRKGKLRLAKRLRKDGFGRAAEAIALDYGRSAEASAPSIMTPALRNKMQQDSARASRIRDVNFDLTEQLIRKTQSGNRNSY
tara:strand:+ start:10593 stop:11366 length:774 start_codon:yes stop_codon:yes gene_type:complete